MGMKLSLVVAWAMGRLWAARRHLARSRTRQVRVGSPHRLTAFLKRPKFASLLERKQR